MNSLQNRILVIHDDKDLHDLLQQHIIYVTFLRSSKTLHKKASLSYD